VIIGSIYPEKLTFDGFQYRTTRVNEAVELIYALDKGFTKNETGQTKEVFDLSSVVARRGLSPASYRRPPLIHPAFALPKWPRPTSVGLVLFSRPLWRAPLSPLPQKQNPS
jgi:hypothetical protein